MRKKIKRVLVVFLGLILFLVFVLTVISIPIPNVYSEKSHIERVSERIGKRYKIGETQEFLEDDEVLTGFKVYPLYTEYDKLAYFLVEFEPYGFVYVKIHKNSIFQFCFVGLTMYSESEVESPWRRYKVSETEDYRPSDEDKIWEVDKDGEFIYYNTSPFSAADIKDEQRYLLKLEQGGSSYYIPAVKRGDKYLNLISMEEMDIKDGVSSQIQAVQFVGFIDKRLYFL